MTPKDDPRAGTIEKIIIHRKQSRIVQKYLSHVVNYAGVQQKMIPVRALAGLSSKDNGR